MADEKLTLELQVQGVADALRQIGQVSHAVGSVGSAGVSSGFGGAASALGSASKLGQIAAVAGTVVIALAALAGAVKRAAEAMNEFGRLQDQLGSTTGETAMLKTLAAAFGAGDPLALATSLREAMLSGLGAGFATRAGVRIQPSDVGDPANLAKIAIQLMDQIRRDTPGQALNDARSVGHPELVQARRISDEMWEKLKKDAAEVSRLLGPQHQQRAFELNLAMTQLSQKWEYLKLFFLSAFIPILELATNALLTFVRFIAMIPGSGLRQQDIDAALNANTQANNRNTHALEQLSGIYGGGARVRGAIPGAFGPGMGYRLNDAVRAHTLRLGAYSVSL